jgi:hypothetical protein
MKISSLFRVVLLVLFCLIAPWAGAASNPDLSGRVVFVDGDVTANGRDAETGDLLVGPTVLKTGKASTIEVVFANRNVFRLGANTILKIDFAELKKTVTLENGVFTSVLKKLGQFGGDAAFVLKTPTVNAGVRGTSFHVSTDGNSTYVCTCNGSVALDDPDGGNAEVLTNAHHGARIFTKEADGSITVKPAGIQGHSDASIISLADKIGVGVDWTKADLDHGQTAVAQ